MLYFLGKAVKIAAALGVPPPNPCWPPSAGGFAPIPPKLLPTLNLRVIFEHYSDFSVSLKLRLLSHT